MVGEALEKKESRECKIELDRIAAMLSRLGGRGYCVKEGTAPYGQVDFVSDSDPDPDSES